MESIDKLREMLEECKRIANIKQNPYDTYWTIDADCSKCIDAIEAEVAEKYMLLPVDANEITVHLGDELESIDTGDHSIVTGLTADSVQCDASALWELASHYRHVSTCKNLRIEPDIFECSECGGECRGIYGEMFDYCPYCGAKVVGKS